jgi:hypothetical protein
MTADITAAPVMEYGVKYWSRETGGHVTVDCGPWVEAWTLLRDKQQHVDASALLMARLPGDTAWCAVSPDESTELWAAHMDAQRQAVRHG